MPVWRCVPLVVPVWRVVVPCERVDVEADVLRLTVVVVPLASVVRVWVRAEPLLVFTRVVTVVPGVVADWRGEVVVVVRDEPLCAWAVRAEELPEVVPEVVPVVVRDDEPLCVVVLRVDEPVEAGCVVVDDCVLWLPGACVVVVRVWMSREVSRSRALRSLWRDEKLWSTWRTP